MSKGKQAFNCTTSSQIQPGWVNQQSQTIELRPGESRKVWFNSKTPNHAYHFKLVLLRNAASIFFIAYSGILATWWLYGAESWCTDRLGVRFHRFESNARGCFASVSCVLRRGLQPAVSWLAAALH